MSFAKKAVILSFSKSSSVYNWHYQLIVAICHLLYFWRFLSETCYCLQKLVSFRSCCTSRNFFACICYLCMAFSELFLLSQIKTSNIILSPFPGKRKWKLAKDMIYYSAGITSYNSREALISNDEVLIHQSKQLVGGTLSV